MLIPPALLPEFIQAMSDTVEKHAEEVAVLDQAIGDGDHVFNLRRGLLALNQQSTELAILDWAAAWQNIGMSMMSSIGGASGSLYGTLFMAMSKAARDKPLTRETFADVFAQGVESVKQRGKAGAGEKTMLDVYIPVSEYLNSIKASEDIVDVLKKIVLVATEGMESTRDMVATKGRASFLGERSKGHIDAGARTGQLMICAVVDVITEYLGKTSTSPT